MDEGSGLVSDTLEDIPTAHLEFGLIDGHIHDWLVLGPVSTALSVRVPELTPGVRESTVRAMTPLDTGIVQPPAERATCRVGLRGGEPVEARWQVVQTGADHWVDLACTHATAHFACAWAYALVIAPQSTASSLVLTTCTPTEVWINGAAVFECAKFDAAPAQIEFAATLTEGVNEVLVRTATVGAGDFPMGVGLRLRGVEEATVQLPTTLEPVARRQKLAAVMAEAELAQAVYGRDEKIVVRWPKDMNRIDALTARLQTPSARIYAEAHPMVQKGAKVDFGEARQYPDGDYEVVLQPQFDEYYVQDMRVQHRLPLRIANAKWSSLYYGTPEEHRQEALTEAAKRKDHLYAEVAKAALGQWSNLRREVVDQAVTLIQKRAVGCERELMALLGLAARFRDLPDFPDDLGWAIEECATQVAFATEPLPGILGAACQLLAGQLYADRSFVDHHAGEWQQLHGEQAVRAWLHQWTQTGAPHGESSNGLADALVALSHLTDMAVSDEIADMSAVAIDKLAYLIALNSFHGVWGGCQEGAVTRTLFGGGLGPLSGVCRLWWGHGAFTADCAAAVALACAESYQLPEIIAAVAVDRSQDAWTQRHDLVQVEGKTHSLHRVALRTLDYLVASQQDRTVLHEGAVPWQVTLGKDAVIFGNHPAMTSEHEAFACNLWRGNRCAPRIAQWQDCLMVVYARDPQALPFTHAYFPMAAFDEVEQRRGWAFARKGGGYVAITATGGVALTTKGQHAQRELRAAAPGVWLVQMGRAQTDGAFADFVARVLEVDLELGETGVRFAGLRGEQLAFADAGPLTLGGREQPLGGPAHIAGPYGVAKELPAHTLDITFQDNVMRLDFGGG